MKKTEYILSDYEAGLSELNWEVKRVAQTIVEERNEHLTYLFSGPYGTGKTHLLRSITDYLDENSPEDAIYMTSEDVIKKLINVKPQDLTSPKYKAYIHAGCLAIDDIDLIIGDGIEKEHRQDILSALITLRENNGNITILSNNTSAAISLKSTYPIVDLDVENADVYARCEIAQRELAKEDVQLPFAAVKALAEDYHSVEEIKEIIHGICPHKGLPFFRGNTMSSKTFFWISLGIYQFLFSLSLASLLFFDTEPFYRLGQHLMPISWVYCLVFGITLAFQSRKSRNPLSIIVNVVLALVVYTCLWLIL